MRGRSRSAYKTPRSNKKRRIMRQASSGSSSVSALVSNVLSSKSFKNAALRAATKFLAPGVPTSTFLGKPMAKKKMAKGFSGEGKLSGKIGKGQRVSKQVKLNGKYTRYGIEKYGVTLATEHRTQVSGKEVIGIGHTSLPAKFANIQLWRAILKHMFVKMGCQVRDTGVTLGNFGFVTGDVFTYYYYEFSGSTATTGHSITIDANDTFDELAGEFAAFMDDKTDALDDRIESIVFTPHTNSKWGSVNIKLTPLKVAVHSKSILKIQNITVENATDNEADDVTRVPLQGMLYHCNGNNWVRKSNGVSMPGLYDSNNEHTLYSSWDKTSTGVGHVGGTSVEFYVGFNGQNSADTTFSKVSELPKPYEISNCVRAQKFYVDAGGIRTSVLEQTFEMSLAAYYKLIYQWVGTNNAALYFNPKLGKTNMIVLDKVIGRPQLDGGVNDLKLWTETEFRLTTFVYGRDQNRTLPITYQINKT